MNGFFIALIVVDAALAAAFATNLVICRATASSAPIAPYVCVAACASFFLGLSGWLFGQMDAQSTHDSSLQRVEYRQLHATYGLRLNKTQIGDLPVPASFSDTVEMSVLTSNGYRQVVLQLVDGTHRIVAYSHSTNKELPHAH